jgi:NAD(P)H dehydrogenase (quinone)
MSSSLPSVLVTGATGSTGVEVVKALSSTNRFRVLAAVRDLAKAKDLERLPNVVPTLLTDDPHTVTAAFHGVHAAYLLAPPQTDPLFDTWLKAAKSSHVHHVVYHSAAGAGPVDSAPFDMAREHGEHEAKLKASGLHFTILQPTYFHQNLEKFHRPTITQYASFGGSAGDGRFSSVDLRDVGAFAAVVFTNPEAYEGKTVLLTGDVTSEPAIAAELTKAAGRPIQYTSWSPEEHRDKLKSWGMPDWLADNQLALDKLKREGMTASVDPELEKGLQRKPLTIHQYVHDNAELWKEPAVKV